MSLSCANELAALTELILKLQDTLDAFPTTTEQDEVMVVTPHERLAEKSIPMPPLATITCPCVSAPPSLPLQSATSVAPSLEIPGPHNELAMMRSPIVTS